MKYNHRAEEWELTMKDVYNDILLFAGEPMANEEFRHWVEDYNLDFIVAEDELHEVEEFIQSAQQGLKKLRAKINATRRPNKGLKEWHKALVWRRRRAIRRREELEFRINMMLGDFDNDPLPRKRDFEEHWEKEDPDAYTSIFHWRWAHDLAVQKEFLLRSFLKRSTDKQDKKVLSRLDFLKERKQISSWWYHQLSKMICDKYVDEERLAEFDEASKEEKRKLRKNPKFFWEAASHRLENFRKACEKNNESWGPTQMPGPKDREVSLDPEMNYGANNLGLTEDALISLLDERSKLL